MSQLTPLVRGRRSAGTGISRRPERYAPVIESGCASRSSTEPLVDHLAAVLAGAGTDVDDPVGDPDGVLVVLDDDQGVAEVLEPDQGLDQPVVVALVQADGRLVEDVEHAHQAGTDLGGEPDALRLAAGERAGGPVQVQVVQADVEQELRRSWISLRTWSPICRSRSGQVEVVGGSPRASLIGSAQTSAMFLPPSSCERPPRGHRDGLPA